MVGDKYGMVNVGFVLLQDCMLHHVVQAQIYQHSKQRKIQY